MEGLVFTSNGLKLRARCHGQGCTTSLRLVSFRKRQSLYRPTILTYDNAEAVTDISAGRSVSSLVLSPEQCHQPLDNRPPATDPITAFGKLPAEYASN